LIFRIPSSPACSCFRQGGGRTLYVLHALANRPSTTQTREDGAFFPTRPITKWPIVPSYTLLPRALKTFRQGKSGAENIMVRATKELDRGRRPSAFVFIFSSSRYPPPSS
ncbi:unnamed protein product, partial [Ectocarpus sp. 12 AP-2014]